MVSHNHDADNHLYSHSAHQHKSTAVKITLNPITCALVDNPKSY